MTSWWPFFLILFYFCNANCYSRNITFLLYFHLLYFCIFRNDCRNTPRRHVWCILYICFLNESSVIVANRLLFNLIKISLYGKCNRDLLENQLSGNVTVLLCAKQTIRLHHQVCQNFQNLVSGNQDSHQLGSTPLFISKYK